MALGIAEIIVAGLLLDWLFRKMKVPGLIGLLLLGILIGPYALDILDPNMKSVSGDLRIIALIIILLRAGLELSKESLAKVGMRAIMMSFIPCILEISFVTYFAQKILGLTFLESAMLGAVLGAVSPAVVVPIMIKYIEEGRGAKKGIPTLVLAGASCDDAVAIVLCSSFVGMYVGENINVAWQLIGVPISITIGIITGLGIGTFLYKVFEKFHPRATKKVLILIGVSVLLVHFEKYIEHFIPFAALIAVMSIGFIILEKKEKIAHQVSSKLGKIWVLAQLLLFAVVGTQVNISVAFKAGLSGSIVILLGLLGRAIGVQLCLIKSNFNLRERLFIGISYIPKATVQAAIGAAPLIAMQKAGISTFPGELILAVAVLSIIITAPLGAILISWAGDKFLTIDFSKNDTAKAAVIDSE